MKLRVAVFTLFVVLLAAAFCMGVITRYPVRYMDVIRRNAGVLEPSLVFAVIHAESKFRPNARSNKGAAGLMQITDDTAEWLAAEMRLEDFNISHILEPEVNITIGCFFLNWLLDYYDGNLQLALCAYNAGLGNVNRWLNDPRYSRDGQTLDVIPFPETDQYIRRVINNQKIYDIILSLWRHE